VAEVDAKIAAHDAAMPLPPLNLLRTFDRQLVAAGGCAWRYNV